MKHKLSLEDLKIRSFITNDTHLKRNAQGGTNNNNNGDQSYQLICQVTLDSGCDFTIPTFDCGATYDHMCQSEVC